MLGTWIWIPNSWVCVVFRFNVQIFPPQRCVRAMNLDLFLEFMDRIHLTKHCSEWNLYSIEVGGKTFPDSVSPGFHPVHVLFLTAITRISHCCCLGQHIKLEPIGRGADSQRVGKQALAASCRGAAVLVVAWGAAASVRSPPIWQWHGLPGALLPSPHQVMLVPSGMWSRIVLQSCYLTRLRVNRSSEGYRKCCFMGYCWHLVEFCLLGSNWIHSAQNKTTFKWISSLYLSVSNSYRLPW